MSRRELKILRIISDPKEVKGEQRLQIIFQVDF